MMMMKLTFVRMHVMMLFLVQAYICAHALDGEKFFVVILTLFYTLRG
jgi:hypothetical protein